MLESSQASLIFWLYFHITIWLYVVSIFLLFCLTECFHSFYFILAILYSPSPLCVVHVYLSHEITHPCITRIPYKRWVNADFSNSLWAGMFASYCKVMSWVVVLSALALGVCFKWWSLGNKNITTEFIAMVLNLQSNLLSKFGMIHAAAWWSCLSSKWVRE